MPLPINDDSSIADVMSELVHRARQGDHRAFDQLVIHCQDSVRACLAVRVDDLSEADDLAQEAFLLAYQKLAQLEVPEYFPAWVRGIAVNLCRNHLRRRRERQSGSLAELESMADIEIDQLDREISSEAMIMQLRRCVGELDADQQALLVERYQRGVSVEALCRATGRGHSAMTMVLFRLRERLRRCLERHLVGMEVHP